ncbi:hypothetical protein AAVH_20381 [Aphelenchoides avenae]|nr:hypothetical protein AAVH_20381 [Aphelenchus avenae]
MRCNICNTILQSHHTTNAKKHIAAKHGIKGGPPPTGDGQAEFMDCFDSPQPSDQSLILNDITMTSCASPLPAECYTPPAKKMNLEQSIFDFVQSALGKSVDVPSTSQSSPGEKQPKG